jgi:uncharacterized protein YidB (DUF937 family)
MGILDIIMGQLAGPSATRPWLPRVMEGLFAAAPDGIGLHELLARMEKAGMGDIAASWTGTGPNKPITVAQLHQILTPHDLARIASHAKLNEHEVLGELAEHLPGVIDGLTPGGKIPD